MVPVTVLLEQAANQIVIRPNSNTDKELKKKFEVCRWRYCAVLMVVVGLAVIRCVSLLNGAG